MSKEGLLISILKSGQSIAEPRKSNKNNAEIKEINERFNVLRNNFSKKKKKKEKQKKLEKKFIEKKRPAILQKNQKKKQFNKTRRRIKKTLR